MTMYSDVSNEEYELIKDSNKVKAAAIMTDFRERLMSEGQCLACAGTCLCFVAPRFFPLRDFFEGKDSSLGAYFFVPLAKSLV